MNCQEATERLSEFFDGELPLEIGIQVREHVENCEACMRDAHTFTWIQEKIRSAHVPTSARLEWDKIVGQLDEPETKPIVLGRKTRVPRLAMVVGLSLAASLLIFFNFRIQEPKHPASHDLSRLGVAIDFEELLAGPTSEPMVAFNRLNKRFESLDATGTESERLLGYQPSLLRQTPPGIQLVSNRVIKLPHCNCPGGKCTCGPTGCNCAASLCERSDGSKLLVLEHCETQIVSFGKLESMKVIDEVPEFELLKSGDTYAATWIVDHRRLTAIGLKGKEDAKSLVGSFASR